jgi:hypothetical protein
MLPRLWLETAQPLQANPWLPLLFQTFPLLKTAPADGNVFFSRLLHEAKSDFLIIPPSVYEPDNDGWSTVYSPLEVTIHITTDSLQLTVLVGDGLKTFCDHSVQ